MLRSFLEKDVLFLTAEFREAGFEARARRNLAKVSWLALKYVSASVSAHGYLPCKVLCGGQSDALSLRGEF